MTSWLSPTKKTFCGKDAHQAALEMVLVHLIVSLGGAVLGLYRWLNNTSETGREAGELTLVWAGVIVIDLLFVYGNRAGKGYFYMPYVIVTFFQVVLTFDTAWNLINPEPTSVYFRRYYTVWAMSLMVLCWSLASLAATVRSLCNLNGDADGYALPLRKTAADS
ncbi:hypothetical protein M3Y99_00982400 [Aphelenchoides fujianensis]|nr:hypothetical protein M3Y99_00982400 [Aphelenchoides fujianensis]